MRPPATSTCRHRAPPGRDASRGPRALSTSTATTPWQRPPYTTHRGTPAGWAATGIALHRRARQPGARSLIPHGRKAPARSIIDSTQLLARLNHWYQEI